jgi:hypothetical protein
METSRPARDEIRAIVWWALVGAAAGAIAGLVVGGIGGRLAMLLLRLTSPELVIGATSDDGFEIGVVTTETLGLLAGMTMLGAVNGVLYAAVRGWLPRRLRLPLWSLAVAALGGATIVHEDGVDFTQLEPVALAIALFVILPGVAAALVVLLVERWVDREPFSERRLDVVVVVAALCGTFALVVGVVVGVAALVGRDTGLNRVLLPVARVVAPLALAAVGVVAAVDLVGTASRLL